MHRQINKKQFDLIVIGSGAAGLMTAITAFNNGIKNIAIISKVLPVNSHTASAKGGINAALGNVVEDDWQWHAFDTIKGGDYLCDVDAVEILCKNANQAIINLEKYGVVFSRDRDGKIAQRAYGGQTINFGGDKIAYRACYSKDKTGYTILDTLYQQAIKLGIKFFNEFIVYDLLIPDQNQYNQENNHITGINQVYGCVAIDINQGEINIFNSMATVIATGGYSQIYHNSTSSLICTGEGLNWLFKASIALQDMEFVQFHPTAIANCGFLISEAARSEGAYLLNGDNQRFMAKYAPKMLELASRDIVSRAIATEIFNGNGCGKNKDYVHLDLRHLSKETLNDKLPGIVELVKKFLRIDVAKDLIPIQPSAHYTMGGITTDNNCNVLNYYQDLCGELQEYPINGLFAVGEVGCLSVHGANRLGCNSLLDLIVFGDIAGNKIAKDIANQNYNLQSQEIVNDLVIKKIDNLNKMINRKSFKKIPSIIEIKTYLQKNNDKNLGVFRNLDSMNKGFVNNIETLKKLQDIAFAGNGLKWNEDFILFLELESLTHNSIVANFAAINRCESRGSHYRDDFKLRDDENFLAHSLVRIKKGSKIEDIANVANAKYNLDFFLKKTRNHSDFEKLKITPEARNY